jgi:hypothetical protein
VHWAEFALGPVAQRMWPTPRRRLGPRAQPVCGPRPHGPRPWPVAARAARVRGAGPARPRPAARAAHGDGDGSPAHGDGGEATAHRRGDGGAVCRATGGRVRRRQRRRRDAVGIRAARAISELKITLKEISSNQIAGVEKNSGKFHGGRKLNVEHFSQLTFPPNLHGFRIIPKIPSQK